MNKKPKPIKDDSDIPAQQIQRQRSFTMVNPMSQSLVQSTSKSKNKPDLDVFNLKLKEKNQYKNQTYCTVCFTLFTIGNRQHHCRACANAICSNCSPAKINKQKCCDICYMKYSNPNQEQRKNQILNNLETLCAIFICKKNEKTKQLKELRQISNKVEVIEQNKQLAPAHDESIKLLEDEFNSILQKKKMKQRQLDALNEQKQKLKMLINQL